MKLEYHKVNKFLFFIVLFSFKVFASVQVSSMIETIDTGSDYSNILKITSESDQTQYVKIKVMKVINPLRKGQKEVELNSDSNLIISPQLFVLPARSTQTIRLIGLQPPKNEEVYRAYISAFTDNENKNLMQNKSGSISINLTYGVLIYFLPKKESINFVFSGKEITNQSNVKVKILGYDLCKQTSCKHFNIKQSLYPGDNFYLNNVSDKYSNLKLTYKSQMDNSDKNFNIIL